MRKFKIRTYGVEEFTKKILTQMEKMGYLVGEMDEEFAHLSVDELASTLPLYIYGYENGDVFLSMVEESFESSKYQEITFQDLLSTKEVWIEQQAFARVDNNFPNAQHSFSGITVTLNNQNLKAKDVKIQLTWKEFGGYE